jgi:diguanylate cyclase (GGDEF)-like protein
METRSPRVRSLALAIGLVVCLGAAVPPLALRWVAGAQHERELLQEQINRLDRVEGLVVDAETGQRGYVITGQEAYLEPYHAALALLPNELDALQRLSLRQPPEQRALVERIVGNVQQKQQELARIIELRRGGGFEAALAAVNEGLGKRFMDAVRRDTQALIRDENRELDTLAVALDAKIGAAVAFALTASVLTLGLLLYLARSVLRASQARSEAAAQLTDANTRLNTGMAQLERRNQQISQLADMSRHLQNPMSLGEGLAVASAYCARLLPGTRGAVYLFRHSANLLELAGTWGPDAVRGEAMEPGDCWGLRRGQLHLSDGDHGMRCAHLPPAHPRHCDFCQPLAANGEVLGLMTLDAAADGELSYDEVQTVVATLAEQLALALGNTKLRQVLRDQSIKDPLTGLYNRRYMEETLVRELCRARRQNAPLAVIAIDLDHFKRINDTHGHATGDGVLKMAADELRAALRASDVACRLGGEEFVLILPECSSAAAEQKAVELGSRLRRSRSRTEGGSWVSVTASFGIASTETDGFEPTRLLAAADNALYAAKRAGRDRAMRAGEPPVLAGATAEG